MIIPSIILNVIIGSLFLLSFSSKIFDISDLRNDVAVLRIIPKSLTDLSIYALLFVELGISISYLFNLWLPFRTGITVMLLIFFIVVTWLKRRRTGTVSCTCFGTNRMLNKNPVIRNIAIIFFCVLDFSMHVDTGVYRGLNNLSYALILVTLIQLYESRKTYKKMRAINEYVNF